MNFDILRQRILEKAIQGKLVPQLESEPEVNQVGEPPENVSFSIPEKWKWIHFSEAIETVSTKLFQIKSKEVLDKGLYPVVSQSKEILDGYSDNKNKLIPESKLPIILFGDHTRVLKYIDYRFIVGADGTKLLRVKNPALYPKYVYMALKWLINLTRERGYSRHFQFIKCVYLPCPPLEEQQRIIEKTKQLFDQINQAEKAYNELSGPLSERFRQLCLEKAIQGKLVPQLESEPVVNQIGDIPDNCPFRLPGKWKWIKLGAVFSLKAGKFISASEIKDSGAYPCYGGNGKRGYVDKFNREGRFPLIGRQGALCGNINLVDGKFYATEHAVVADGGNLVDPDCAAIFLKALNLNQYATKTAQPGLSVKRISKTPFPLAPIQEQRRIVKKVQDLLLKITSIK